MANTVMHLITKSMKFDEFALNLHTEVFVQRLPLNPRAKPFPQPKYASAPSMAVGEGVEGGWDWRVCGGAGACQALVRERQTTHHNPGWSGDG